VQKVQKIIRGLFILSQAVTFIRTPRIAAVVSRELSGFVAFIRLILSLSRLVDPATRTTLVDGETALALGSESPVILVYPLPFVHETDREESEIAG
jgi:hypothetical protein